MPHRGRQPGGRNQKSGLNSLKFFAPGHDLKVWEVGALRCWKLEVRCWKLEVESRHARSMMLRRVCNGKNMRKGGINLLNMAEYA